MMFFNSIINECIKIAAKPRSYLGLGAITLLVGVVLFALRADGNNFIGFATASFEQTLSFHGNILNGNLVAFIIMQTLIIHVPLLVALVTGDLVSGEGASGTIRLLLTKPLSRSSILLSKFVAGASYTAVIILWLGVLGILVARSIFGVGDVVVLNSDGLVILQQSDILWRFAYGLLVAWLALLTVATLSITLSCFSDNSIGPIVATMAIIILFTIIASLDVRVFDSVRPLLFTTHMAAWRSFFEDPLPMEDIRRSIIVLVSHIVILLSIALWRFQTKDINA